MAQLVPHNCLQFLGEFNNERLMMQKKSPWLKTLKTVVQDDEIHHWLRLLYISRRPEMKSRSRYVKL